MDEGLQVPLMFNELPPAVRGLAAGRMITGLGGTLIWGTAGVFATETPAFWFGVSSEMADDSVGAGVVDWIFCRISTALSDEVGLDDTDIGPLELCDSPPSSDSEFEPPSLLLFPRQPVSQSAARLKAASHRRFPLWRL